MHGTLPYMPIAIRHVMAKRTRADPVAAATASAVAVPPTLAIAAYPATDTGSVASMVTPRRLSRSEARAMRTGFGGSQGLFIISMEAVGCMPE